MPVPPQFRAGVVLPVRGFVDGKTRLAPRLDAAHRRDLAEELATRAVTAARADDLSLCVVTSAPEAEAWADALGVTVLPDPGSLDTAAAAGHRWAADLGLDRVVVAHADLPFVTSFAALIPADVETVVLAPCHRFDGTNAIGLPVPAGFTFAYGPGSFARHRAEADRRGHPVVIVRDRALAFDVDDPVDLDELERAAR